MQPLSKLLIAVSLGIGQMTTNPFDNYQIEPAVLGGVGVGKINWVIRNFLARGSFLLLSAEMGSGKSTILYRAAEAIHQGNLFLDQLPTTKGRVLVIQGDEPARDAEKKFRRMGLEAQFEICYLSGTLDLRWLEQQIRSKVYSAILIDSITSLLATNELDVTDLGFSRKLYCIGKALADANVAGLITSHLNKPPDHKIRDRVTKHDIQGVATIGAAVSDVWGMWKHPKPEWSEHYNLLCLGKRNCTEGTLWKLEGNAENFYWSLREVGDGLKPQERLSIEAKITAYFEQSSERLPLDEIAAKIGTSYECVRRVSIEMFEVGLLTRTKVETGKKGRPSYLYGPP